MSSSLASALKAYASGAALTVTKSVIQLHGAIGFTEEFDAGLYLKRAMWLSAQLGNEAVQRGRFERLARTDMQDGP
jgi:alkylation response protein AidB-like acyl-CoA dehydrogenase